MSIEDWYYDYMDEKNEDTQVGILVAPTIHETDKAWLVRAGGEEVWLPKSKCSRQPEGLGGDTYTIPEWLVLKKGLDPLVEWEML